MPLETSCKSPINIITSTATPDSNGLQFNYTSGDCKSKKDKTLIELRYESKNTVIYKNTTYALMGIILFKNSIHSIDGKFFAGELIMYHISTISNLHYLNICIPISLTTDIKKSSFGTILKTVPSTVLSFQSPKEFIPTTSYYSYTGTNPYVCSIPTEYIVFSSSNLNITPAEFNGITNNTFKQAPNTGIVIYSHSNQSSAGSGTDSGASPITTIGSLVSTANKAVSFGDDNIYIDCQSVDAPDSFSGATGASPAPVDSINFSNLQNSGVIQMLLMFIIFMVIMVIFFYSYEFTTGMFRELTKSVAKMNTAL
jgi:carbonic anhydrase